MARARLSEKEKFVERLDEVEKKKEKRHAELMQILKKKSIDRKKVKKKTII